MTRYLFRFLLIAAAFYFAFPMIPGLQFHGTFLHAIVVGLLFTVLGWFVELAVIALSAIWTIGTGGMALIILIPAWLMGFFLLPAIVLRVLANLMPSSLAISGWEPAIWGGLIMFFIGVVTSREVGDRSRSSRTAESN